MIWWSQGGLVVVVSRTLHCCSLSQASIFCNSCCWPNTQSHFYTSYRQTDGQTEKQADNIHSICLVSVFTVSWILNCSQTLHLSIVSEEVHAITKPSKEWQWKHFWKVNERIDILDRHIIYKLQFIHVLGNKVKLSSYIYFGFRLRFKYYTLCNILLICHSLWQCHISTSDGAI